jgi:hypothetical protein
MERLGLELLCLMVQVAIGLRQARKLWNARRKLRMLEQPFNSAKVSVLTWNCHKEELAEAQQRS